MQEKTSLPDPAADVLGWQVFLYAGGELDDADARALERRLGEDQSAREALCRAVQLVQTLSGRAPAVPEPAYRTQVRQRLQAQKSFWNRLAGARTYRGHPAAWAGLGAVAAALLTLTLTNARYFVAARTSTPAADQATAADNTPTGAAHAPSIEMANVWAALHNSSHIFKAHGEEARRKQRAEERHPAKMDDRKGRVFGIPMMNP